MPELPELEGFKYYIEQHCLKKTIKDVVVDEAKILQGISAASFKKNLVGHSFANVQRYGKYLVIALTTSDEKLVFHFALTGSLNYVKKAQEKVRFSAIHYLFSDGSALYFTVIRKFAKTWLVKNIKAMKAITSLGPDALELSWQEFIKLADNNSKKNIKAFLMDQKVIAGIGNEYSDEILFQAGVDPHHAIKDLSQDRLKKIYNEMRTILEFVTKLRIKEVAQEAPEFFTQHDRAVLPKSYLLSHRHIDMVCPKNKNHVIKKVKIAGRSAYYCPEDQT